MEFNMVVTYEPGRENVEWVFQQLNSCIGTTYVVVKVRPSIILLKVSDPYDTWLKLKKCLYKADTAVHRVIPVDEIVDPLVEKVAKKAKEYVDKRVPKDATFRVTLHGRLYRVDERGRLVREHSMDAVRAIAKGIDRRVDLKNPQWTVYVRTVPVHKWFIVAALSVARSHVFKNIRVGEPAPPL
ncbi:MAG: hypothetical protein GXO32_02790 [Crenarchaeota archaeon]|nr:hypothetical protein [Thermoproteota archaeon]